VTLSAKVVSIQREQHIGGLKAASPATIGEARDHDERGITQEILGWKKGRSVNREIQDNGSIGKREVNSGHEIRRTETRIACVFYCDFLLRWSTYVDRELSG
jgi:hypothetical protein